jgi:hypothetical protein
LAQSDSVGWYPTGLHRYGRRVSPALGKGYSWKTSSHPSQLNVMLPSVRVITISSESASYDPVSNEIVANETGIKTAEIAGARVVIN